MSAPRGIALSIRTGYRFQFEEAQGLHVLLFPEGMITLGDSAAEILKCVDGTCSLEDIVARLEQRFPGADLEDDVIEFLDTAFDKGWISGG